MQVIHRREKSPGRNTQGEKIGQSVAIRTEFWGKEYQEANYTQAWHVIVLL